MTKMFTVHDHKAAYYSPPFYARTNMEAIRTFAQAVNDPTHDIGRNHSDFTLFELGEFNDQTGEITLLETKAALGNGVDFKAQ